MRNVKNFLLVLLLPSTMAVTAAFSLPARAVGQAVLEPLGIRTILNRAKSGEWIITKVELLAHAAIGIPKFYKERMPLSMALQDIFSANSITYARMPDSSWTSKEWKKQKLLTDLLPGNINRLKLLRKIDENTLPRWYHLLPAEIKSSVSSFLAFYSGAYWIFVYGDTEAGARKLVTAINARNTPLWQE